MTHAARTTQRGGMRAAGLVGEVGMTRVSMMLDNVSSFLYILTIDDPSRFLARRHIPEVADPVATTPLPSARP
ncbi:hypothetical protein GCM10011600_25780 [Pseudolysinimonas yzui]|uniref:Uncharacterized protein n=1 Tax=Pseudolysinimonas yzui TaxID=2708254 RepID=A0A8J3GSU7_9MICO|nr:hypothetical protein GCM10011600_25780 [Pseudolysinimonas yzui]